MYIIIHSFFVYLNSSMFLKLLLLILVLNLHILLTQHTQTTHTSTFNYTQYDSGAISLPYYAIHISHHQFTYRKNIIIVKHCFGFISHLIFYYTLCIKNVHNTELIMKCFYHTTYSHYG